MLSFTENNQLYANLTLLNDHLLFVNFILKNNGRVLLKLVNLAFTLRECDNLNEQYLKFRQTFK